MRLGALLSNPPQKEYQEVDHFLLNRQGRRGQQVDLEIGRICLNYHCLVCDDQRSFISDIPRNKISCIFVNTKVISIDAVLSCQMCNNDTQIWFLVECESDIRGYAPKVRILKRSERLSNVANIHTQRFGAYTELLDKAEKAFREDLGAGAITYLRKVFEQITVNVANFAGIDFEKFKNGNPKNFKRLLDKVEAQCSIIPNEFAADGYRLFKELSDIVHGDYNELLGLKKFKPLKRLVIGVIENVKNKEELKEAKENLGWSENGV